jgi:hypothetical protein
LNEARSDRIAEQALAGGRVQSNVRLKLFVTPAKMGFQSEN